MKNFLFTILVTMFCAGCATNGSHIVTTNARSPVPVKTVKIYEKIPPSAEIIGEVSATGYGASQRFSDRAIAELKKQAAQIGANGIVITDMHRGFSFGSWSLTGDAIYFTAHAIFVP
jgi:uncharacterized protein YbjQ (UPF0145 family)